MLGLEYVAASDIAKRLGVTRTAVSNWQKRGEFPEPFATVANGAIRIWRWSDVEAWDTSRREAERQAGQRAIARLETRLAQLREMYR